MIRSPDVRKMVYNMNEKSTSQADGITRIGQRFDVASANIASYYGQTIQWETELKYLGIHIVCSRGFKCSLTAAKRSFYKAANAVFGKIGGRSSEDVILQLIRSKCMPALLYGLEACP